MFIRLAGVLISIAPSWLCDLGQAGSLLWASNFPLNGAKERESREIPCF